MSPGSPEGPWNAPCFETPPVRKPLTNAMLAFDRLLLLVEHRKKPITATKSKIAVCFARNS